MVVSFVQLKVTYLNICFTELENSSWVSSIQIQNNVDDVLSKSTNANPD